jgi:hypothetical protein
MSHVDRLALVSKVLLDARFLELKRENERFKRENERLKLSVFWADHSIHMLKKWMQYANKRRAQCQCEVCRHLERWDENDTFEDEECKFGPWFKEALQMHGLSFENGGSAYVECDFLGGVALREDYPKPDVSVHFYLYGRQPYNSWFSWAYGAKLWKAETIHDPELLKLKALFDYIRELSDWDDWNSKWSSDSDMQSDSDLDSFT